MAAKENENETVEEKIPVNRREFLNFAWLASLGFLTVNLAGVTYLFAMPRFKEGEFGGTFTVGKVKDLPPVDSDPENYPKVRMWLSRSEAGLSALYKVCTHLGCLYNWNSQEDKFICPCHGSQFTEEGEFIQGPAPRSLDRFYIKAIDPNSRQILSEATGQQPLAIPDDPEAIIQVETGVRISGKPNA